MLAAEIPSVTPAPSTATALGDVAAQDGCGLARRPPGHGRRPGLQLGIRGRPGNGDGHDAGTYRTIQRVERLDDHAVKVVFSQPTPFWFDAFCGNRSIIPKHLFDAYRGARAREAPTNLQPVGTGPYRFVDFKPGDLVRAEINPHYHVPNRPFFDTLEMKGGGDAASAARAVLQTGEYDYAWNMQVEDDILRRLEKGARAGSVFPPGGIEHIQRNFTDPWKDVDGERSSIKTTHPTLSDPAVRQALNLLVDRSAVQEQIYGRQARPPRTS